jgi:hypothetical protein
MAITRFCSLLSDECSVTKAKNKKKRIKKRMRDAEQPQTKRHLEGGYFSSNFDPCATTTTTAQRKTKHDTHRRRTRRYDEDIAREGKTGNVKQTKYRTQTPADPRRPTHRTKMAIPQQLPAGVKAHGIEA